VDAVGVEPVDPAKRGELDVLDDTVSKIVAATGVVADTIVVGSGAYGVAFDGTHIWVTNYGGDSVSKIVAATGAVTATIDVGNGPGGGGL
jgi:YVTN family beta-propeller protein